jgi:hypothetical protein
VTSDPQCDWCRRPGAVRSFASIAENDTQYRDPILCDVCWLLIAAPGEVEEARTRWAGYEEAMNAFEQELAERWQVRMGTEHEVGQRDPHRETGHNAV